MSVCVGVMERHEVRQLIQGIPVATTVLTKSPLIWSNDNSIALVTQHGTYILVGNCFIYGLLLYNYGRNNFFFIIISPSTISSYLLDSSLMLPVFWIFDFHSPKGPEDSDLL